MLAPLRSLVARLWPRSTRQNDAPSVVEGAVTFLRDLINESDSARGVLRDIAAFNALPRDRQHHTFPALYLLLEKYLVEVQGGTKREQLRRVVRSKFPDLVAEERIGLVFAPAVEQEICLARQLLIEVIDHAMRLYGAVGTSALPDLHDWTHRIPTSDPVPTVLRIKEPAPTDDHQWFAYLILVTQHLYSWLATSVGSQTAGTLFDHGYRQVRDIYDGLETFPAIIRCLPDRLLDEEKIELLSRGQIQQVLLEKAEELQRINDQLLAQNQELASARGELEAAKQDLERRVEVRTLELSDALAQKDTLLREVHHRVKNNMQVICSLLNLQADREQEEQIIGALRESHDRVRSMALIHEQLYSAPDLASIDFAQYADSLLGQIRSSHDGSGRIQITASVDHPPVSVEVGVPCGLIVTELVTNALKHAFPEQRPGCIEVTLRLRDDRRSELCVVDDGVGVAEELDVATSDSLGLNIVYVLSRQLRGSVTFDGRAGTRAVILFGPNE